MTRFRAPIKAQIEVERERYIKEKARQTAEECKKMMIEKYGDEFKYEYI